MNYKYSTLAVAIVALLSGCGAEDNKSLSGDNNNIKAPILKGEATIPALHVGMDAQGNYEYFDPNPTPRPEGNTIFQWRDANDATLGNEQTLAITYPLLGEQVRFCVQPVAQGDINNVGDEICSEPRQVEAALGEKPTAENVLLDNAAPTVGETLIGSYDYMHSDPESEGESQLLWKMGSGDEQVAIPNATGETLVLEPITQGKAVAFCVTPMTDDTPVLRGEEVCSDATALVAAKSGTAPEAKSVAIAGAGFVGAKLEGSYVFDDADEDIEGASQLVWKRDNAAIVPAVTTASYTAVDADTDKKLTFCVTPIAVTGIQTDGDEVCSSALTIIKKDEVSPVAANVAISVESDGLAEAGQVLVASYGYSQENDALEGESVGYWTVGSVKQDDCTVAQGCEYSLTQADIGKEISFSVTPYTNLGTPGEIAHSKVPTEVMGIKLSGVLEYDNQLIAVVYGYDGDVATAGKWMIDTDNQDGPLGNLSPVSQSTGITYIIGNRGTVENTNAYGVKDTNANGIIDDIDWLTDTTAKPVNAGSFVGKDVEFCLETVSYGEKCVSAADFAEVEGGMLVAVDDNIKRVIEPVRTFVVDSDGISAHTYHRPLTVTEAQLKDAAGFGVSIPDNGGVHLANGIEWAMFAALERDLDPAVLYPTDNAAINVNVCRNLYSDLGEWYLPATYKSSSKYDTNYFAHASFGAINLGAPDDNRNNFKTMSTSYFKGDSDKLSPVFGWPVGSNNDSYPGASMTISGDKAGQFHRYRFNGGNTSTSTTSTPQLLICVQ